MTKARSRQKLRNYLATIGWSAPDIADMLAMPVRQNIEALEDLLVESAGARRALKDCKVHFPQAKILDIKPF